MTFSKKLRFATLAILTFVGPVVAASVVLADSIPPGGQAEWNKYFSGPAIIPDPEVNLERLIDTPDPRCVPLQRQIIAQTIQYGRDAYNSKNAVIENEFAAISKFIQGLETSKDPCFDSVTGAYLVASVHLLDPKNSNVGDGIINNDRVNGHPFPNGLELTLLAAALANHKDKTGNHVIEFLTPLRRTQESSKVWNQKIEGGGEFLVSAGYDCVDRKILIDPYLAPLNLGSTFVHELDHMFRDRVKVEEANLVARLNAEIAAANEEMARINALRAGLPDPHPESVDPLDSHLSLKLAMDETLASAVSAYYQRHMEWFHDYLPSTFKNWFLGRTGRPLPLFALEKDLTLFRNDNKGPINEIWNLYSKANNPKSGGELDVDAYDFLLLTFLRGDPFRQPTDEYSAPTAEVQDIYQTIYRGYFNNQSMTSADFAVLDPAHQDSNRDPLSKWLNNFKVTHTSPLQSNQTISEKVDWIREVPEKDYSVGGGMPASGDKIVPVEVDLKEFFPGLDSAFSQLFDSDTLSPYCSQYLDGLKNGELNSYVGNSLSSGFKPGETGVKPGETGVKPGETGVKPGETGVKPGETGVKPELFRPCLNIGPEL